MRFYAILCLAILGIIGCSNPKNNPNPAEDEHAHEGEGIPILVFQDSMELYAIISELVVGDTAEMLVHLTHLSDYSPVVKGTCSYRIVKNTGESAWIPLQLAQAGIFAGNLVPNQAGSIRMDFKLIEDSQEINFSSNELMVYATDEDVPAEDHVEGVSFTKEQAWKTLFGLYRVEPQEFVKAIHCSGEVGLSTTNQIDIVAPSSGRIAFADPNLMEGRFVREGDKLFTLLGTGVGSDNTLVEFNNARTEFEKDKANLERKEKLLKIEAVSQKEYDEARASFNISKKRFELLNDQINEKGMVIKSPVSGYITNINVVANSFADKGDPLVRINRSGKLILKALVPTTQADKLSRINGANMKSLNDRSIHSIAEWGGELISIGRAIDPQSGMIPVYFSIESQELSPGMFVELWLLTDPLPDQIVVPESSLLEEYGEYYVFVQMSGETYDKRLIQISDNNGRDYLVSSGLKPGEVIVNHGALAIKVASSMGTAPVHHH